MPFILFRFTPIILKFDGIIILLIVYVHMKIDFYHFMFHNVDFAFNLLSFKVDKLYDT